MGGETKAGYYDRSSGEPKLYMSFGSSWAKYSVNSLNPAYDAGWTAAHEVWHQFTLRAYSEANPNAFYEMYKNNGKQIFEWQEHNETKPNLNQKGQGFYDRGKYPHPTKPGGPSDKILPYQKEWVYKYLKAKPSTGQGL